ncbi:MAG: DegV family protein [Clostridia bacterium]|nr:DegV family protein [Clostridia bacterium]
MSRIKIMADSPCDLPIEIANEYGITIMPIKFTINNTTYRDKFDMDTDEFYKTLRETGEIPVTSQITPIEFEDYFRETAKDCDEIIAVILSGNASGTFQNAVLAKNIVEEETNVKIHLVDSQSFTFCYGYSALKAAQMVKEGKSSEEIIAKLNEILSKQKVYFGVETLDYLKKGGRIKTTTAVIGGILDIRPLLMIKDGLVSSIDKVKGEKKLFSRMVEYACSAAEEIGENVKFYVLGSDNPDKVDTLEKMLEEKGYKAEDDKFYIGPIIGTHAGPGAYGIMVTID